MAKNCLMSVVTADHFSHYIPLYIYAVRQWSKDVAIRIYVRGEPDNTLDETLLVLSQKYPEMNEKIVFECFLDMPFTVSATNTLRFIIRDRWLEQYENVIVTDIDLMLFKDPFQWHINQMRSEGVPFAGHHGPLHKPHRPEIAHSWTGDFERVAGGFFCYKPAAWYVETTQARKKYADLLRDNRIGNFRESDEVTLARIIKESGYRIPQQRGFPSDLRGIHLGDFKESMKHRWKNIEKMKRKLTEENIRAFQECENDETFCSILNYLRNDQVLSDIIDNVFLHFMDRGMM